ncbi:MAG: acetate uptake transporter [Terrimesophilobacter sp.]
MSDSDVVTEVEVNVLADPIPLGLLGYGMTTVLLSLANTGLFPIDGMVFTMAIFFGGIAQAIVAVMLFLKGNSFGVAAFAGYAFLWLSFAFLNIGVGNHWWTVTSGAVGAYLLVWALFTLGLVIASVVAPRVLTIILILTVILLASLGLGALMGSSALGLFGGYEGILTGALAIYLAFAFLINEMFGKTVLPVGKPFRA